MKQISDTDCNEEITASFTRATFYIPRVAEGEVSSGGQLKPNTAAWTIARAAQWSVAGSNPRNVEYKHRTDRIDIDVVEERVEGATCAGHVSTRFLLRLSFVNLRKLGDHGFSQRLYTRRCRPERFIP